MQISKDPDERMVYIAVSTNGKDKYRIDLEACGGRGQCDCPRWRCKVWPFIRDIPGWDEFTCKHCEEAFRLFGKEMAKDIATLAQKKG